MVGLLFSYALSPVVNWMEANGFRALSRGAAHPGIVSGVGAGVYSLSDDANKLVELLPAATRKLHDSVRRPSGRAQTVP